FSYRSQLRGTALANHEQDQTSGTGPAGIEAHDDEDAGTFRWPSAGLPKMFGRQSAETDEVPDAGADGAPPAGPAMDWQHAFGAPPPPEPDAPPGLYRAPFSRAAHGSSPALPPEAGQTAGDEQPPWPPAPPPARLPGDAGQPGDAAGPAERPEPA